ncbi:MAG: DEAD/DEAH box helicase [Flavobacteriaceae bacterium]|nr:MAG: DEAD/DEAH box helicase [Flavobacteriaceae bacterium]
MPFKKLNSKIKEMLEHLEITTPTPFQSKSIPVIKSGANIFCIAPKNSGKTTTLVLTTLHKLKFAEVGNTPRAVVLVENKERGAEMYAAFFAYTRYKDIRVYLAEEKLHMDMIKSEIFEGIDILIATPNKLNKILLAAGVNPKQINLFSIDDAEFLSQKSANNDLMAITESINKCQFVLYSDKMHPHFKRFQSYFMQHSRIVKM